MKDEHKGFRYFLLTILTLSVVTLTIVEIVRYNDFRRNGNGPGYFFTRENNTVVYRGEIFPEQLKTRTQTVEEMPRTTMQFYESKYNFGVMSEGTVAKHAFRFKNTGSNPLMIAKTDVSCGCTVPEFPMDAISPGADGEITVVYNTSGKSGLQQKNILVHSNAIPEAISITIEADVR